MTKEYVLENTDVSKLNEPVEGGDVEKEKASELVQEDSEVPIVVERVPEKATAY